MKIHVFQHVPFEGPARIADWAKSRSHAVTTTHLYDGQLPPAPDQYDWLVIMGGPMNIYQHAECPWLVAEKRALHLAIRANRAIVGVCLGAQLLADALGGPVTRNGQSEVGWFPVARTNGSGDSLLASLPERFEAFHWHGDTFAIPPGAQAIGASEACANQAFQYGDRMLGLQCHLDYSPDSIELMLEHCGDELVDAPFVQSADEIRRDLDTRAAATAALLETVLDNLAAATG